MKDVVAFLMLSLIAFVPQSDASMASECQEILWLDSNRQVFPALHEMCRSVLIGAVTPIEQKRGYDFIRFGKRSDDVFQPMWKKADGEKTARSDYDYIRFGKRESAELNVQEPINVRFGKRTPINVRFGKRKPINVRFGKREPIRVRFGKREPINVRFGKREGLNQVTSEKKKSFEI